MYRKRNLATHIFNGHELKKNVHLFAFAHSAESFSRSKSSPA